jgi:hypothetical protein
MLVVAGPTAIDVRVFGSGITFSAAVPLIPVKVAVTVSAPVETASASPLALTVATD